MMLDPSLQDTTCIAVHRVRWHSFVFQVAFYYSYSTPGSFHVLIKEMLATSIFIMCSFRYFPVFRITQ